jgi:hypothetical protein
MKKLKLLLCLPIILLLFKACKPDKGCTNGNYYKYIDEYDFSKIPYKDYSELTFINKKTKDTLIFYGQGYQFDFGQATTQEECPQTYNLQRRQIVFKCYKNNDEIKITNFFMGFTTTDINFSYKKNNRIVDPGSISWPFAYDSILIEGKFYYNVKDFTPIITPVNIGFLYTLNEGIIQLIYPNTSDTLNLTKLKL